MIEWLVLPGDGSPDLARRLGRVWRGTAHVAVFQPTGGARVCTFVVPDTVTAVQRPRWPDVLTDWVDIYEEPLFPSPRLPVAGELLSESGSEALALFADLGDPQRPRGGIAWYHKGGVAEFEQAGKAAVAWQKGQPLGRPKAGGVRGSLASLGRRMASTERDAALYDRVESGLAATAETIVTRALLRMLGDDPPPLNELAEKVERAPRLRITLG